MSETIKIEVGKRYRLRNGLETEPMQKSKNGTSYIWNAWVQEKEYPDKSWLCWLSGGKALTHDLEHKHDIITPL